MRHEFALLSQRDPRWGNDYLGLSKTVTLSEAGCYVSSFAVVANYFGHSVSPVDINNMLKDKGLFDDEDLISGDNDLSFLFSDVNYTTSLFFPNVPPTPANLTVLRDLLDDPKAAVIVQIDLGNGQSHFTPIIDCDGMRVTIMNVWNGQEQDFKSVYGEPSVKILKYVVYHGNPIALDPLVCDRRSVRDEIIAKASQWDDIVNHGFTTPQAVYDRIRTLQDQIDSLTQTTVKTNATMPVQAGSNSSVIPDSADNPFVPKEQAKQQSFWFMSIGDLFKLFTKGGK